MTDTSRASADARLESALEGADQRDPRPFYRPVLKYLRENDGEGFQRALRYYEDELIAAVAGEADPLVAWGEYGLMLGRTVGPGRVVELDREGRASPLETLSDARGLALHVPDAPAAPVLVLRYPRQPSAAQHAAYELLVVGRQTASAYE